MEPKNIRCLSAIRENQLFIAGINKDEENEKKDKLVRPKKSWKNNERHYLSALSDKWYEYLMEIQNLINTCSADFYKVKGIKTFHIPITTGSISSPMGAGSDSSPVKINIAGVETYLADSMQFMLEYGCRIFKRGCYYIMPSFRGEDADERHLCQFYHSEAEIPGGLEDIMSLAEEYIRYLCKELLNNLGKEIKSVAGELSHIKKFIDKQNNDLKKIPVDEAIQLLNNDPKLISIHPNGSKTINKYGEKELIKKFDGVVWLTHFEHLSVPFYQAFSSEHKDKALNADMLFGIGEVVGAGERHINGENVLKALRLHKVDREQYQWYYSMKKLYPMRTAGFGMGVERFLLWVLKHDDIRDCQIFPRFNGLHIMP